MADAYADGAWPQAGDRHAVRVADPAVPAAILDCLQDQSRRNGAGDPALFQSDGVGGRNADDRAEFG
ncbi:hypothetical protein D3C72_1969090 [compost metagenome]